MEKSLPQRLQGNSSGGTRRLENTVPGETFVTIWADVSYNNLELKRNGVIFLEIAADFNFKFYYR